MSTITFSGLASGLDTDSIIESLMEIESEPITALEEDIEYYEAETDAYEEFNTLLASLLTAVEKMDSDSDLTAITANSTNEGILTATTTSVSQTGTYHIEVVSLAESQKDVSDEGFADTDSETLSGTLTIGETVIEYSDVTLSELVELVNDEETGVTASMLNDGSEYRLRLTGDEAGETIDIVATGSIEMDTTGADGHTYEASQAHIIVDNVDIYSSSNTITGAVPGTTLNLNDADESEDIILTIESDTDEIVTKLENFVTAYNDILDWIETQSENETDWANDSAIRSVKSKMQHFISNQIGNGSVYDSLASLGLETDYETGELSLDTSVLSTALSDDPEGVISLLAGTDEYDGIAVAMANYLDEETDSTEGLFARRSDSNDETIERLNDQIDKLETRLEKREETLQAQFTAMEELISEMNNWSSYLDELSSSSSD